MVAETGAVLTEAQVVALERKREDDVAAGEIETAHPGYLGSTGHLLCRYPEGRRADLPADLRRYLFQSRLRQALHHQDADHSSRLLNDKVLPMLRILTDRGTEYCGKPEQHDYQLYLAINDIEHTKPKQNHHKPTAICERFHKTILQEFYQVAFRKAVFQTVDQLQKELDTWIEFYNTERTHQGKMCCGRNAHGNSDRRQGSLARKTPRLIFN